jgi:hypothetical protein
MVEMQKPEVAMTLAGEDISFGYVRRNDVIADTKVGPAKMHMEVELPEGLVIALVRCALYLSSRVVYQKGV